MKYTDNTKSYQSNECIIKLEKAKKLNKPNENIFNKPICKADKIYFLETLFNIQPKKITILKGDSSSLCNNILEKQVNSCIYKNSHSPQIQRQNFDSPKFIFKAPTNKGNYRDLITEKNLKSYSRSPTIQRKQIFPKTKIILEKIFEKGTNSLQPFEIISQKDINNPYIYSYTDWNPYSFCTGHRKWGYENGKLKSPSPIFLDNDEWCKTKDMSLDSILKGIKITKEAGLVLVDPAVCAKFNGILSDLVKQILKAVFGHKISLNVKLFEPTSLTQTLTSYFSFASKFLFRSSYSNMDPIERMKNVISLGISGLYMNAKQLKPFNPLISETFQGYFNLDNLENDINRIEVYSEQISNYPTVTRYYITNKLFKIYGFWDLVLEMKSFGNKIICITKGKNTVEFHNINEKIIYSIPSSKIVNAIAKEDRSAHYIGTMVFCDIKNSLRAFIQFAFDKKNIAKIRGYIFRYNFSTDYKFNFDEEYDFFSKLNKDNLTNNKYFTQNDILSEISGSWLGELYFDKIKYWDINEDIPTFIKPCMNCLPSDVRFREDLIWLYRSFYCSKNEEERIYYEKLAQNWKLMVEKVQREERTFKAKFNEELAKKKNNQG